MWISGNQPFLMELPRWCSGKETKAPRFDGSLGPRPDCLLMNGSLLEGLDCAASNTWSSTGRGSCATPELGETCGSLCLAAEELPRGGKSNPSSLLSVQSRRALSSAVMASCSPVGAGGGLTAGSPNGSILRRATVNLVVLG